MGVESSTERMDNPEVKGKVYLEIGPAGTPFFVVDKMDKDDNSSEYLDKNDKYISLELCDIMKGKGPKHTKDSCDDYLQPGQALNIIGDAAYMPIKTGQIDVVIARNVFSWECLQERRDNLLERLSKMVEQMYRVLKMGGEVQIRENLNYDALTGFINEIIKKAQEVGFTVELNGQQLPITDREDYSQANISNITFKKSGK